MSLATWRKHLIFFFEFTRVCDLAPTHWSLRSVNVQLKEKQEKTNLIFVLFSFCLIVCSFFNCVCMWCGCVCFYSLSLYLFEYCPTVRMVFFFRLYWFLLHHHLSLQSSLFSSFVLYCMLASSTRENELFLNWKNTTKQQINLRTLPSRTRAHNPPTQRTCCHCIIWIRWTLKI